MAIGINVKDNVVIELGQERNSLIRNLEQNKIEYLIVFDKVTSSKNKDTVIEINSLGVELTLENDIVNYIKSRANEFTVLDTIKESITGDNTVEQISNIKNKVIERYKAYDSKEDKSVMVDIERVDIKSMQMTFILIVNRHKAKLNIVKDMSGKIHIQSLLLVT